MCALDAEVFNFMPSSCVIGSLCVRARVHVSICEIGGIVTSSHFLHPLKPSQSVGFWMWVKSLKLSCKMDGRSPERIRARWEQTRRTGSEGCGITLLKSGLKRLAPPPGLFLTPSTTRREFSSHCDCVLTFFSCFCCFVSALPVFFTVATIWWTFFSFCFSWIRFNYFAMLVTRKWK